MSAHGLRSAVRLSRVTPALGLAVLLALTAGCENPANTVTEQQGFRGTGMVAVSGARALAVNNAVPEPMAPVPGGGPLAKDIYQNIQVLTDLDLGQFTRLMTAMTQWVSPEQGCEYCHESGEGNASDSKYQKVVSRRMLEMTRHINGNWTSHVQQTGVTCFTCHRGQNVPAQVWFVPPAPTPRAVGNRAGQNEPGIGLMSLPIDPLSAFLTGGEEIRVVGPQAISTGSLGPTIVDTERTYSFMNHISESLGVNCTACHNTRSFFAWDQGRPQRVPAWHGIRMARDLNNNYLVPLTGVFPAERLGPTGDVAKIGCGTCHQGSSKPLNGVSMLRDYPELQPAKPMPAELAPAPAEGAPPDGAAVPPGDLQTAVEPAGSAPGGSGRGA